MPRMSGFASSSRPPRLRTTPDSATCAPAGIRFSMPAHTLNQRTSAVAGGAPRTRSAASRRRGRRAGPRPTAGRARRSSARSSTFATNVARSPSAIAHDLGERLRVAHVVVAARHHPQQILDGDEALLGEPLGERRPDAGQRVRRRGERIDRRRAARPRAASAAARRRASALRVARRRSPDSRIVAIADPRIAGSRDVGAARSGDSRATRIAAHSRTADPREQPHAARDLDRLLRLVERSQPSSVRRHGSSRRGLCASTPSHASRSACRALTLRTPANAIGAPRARAAGAAHRRDASARRSTRGTLAPRRRRRPSRRAIDGDPLSPRGT